MAKSNRDMFLDRVERFNCDVLGIHPKLRKSAVDLYPELRFGVKSHKTIPFTTSEREIPFSPVFLPEEFGQWKVIPDFKPENFLANYVGEAIVVLRRRQDGERQTINARLRAPENSGVRFKWFISGDTAELYVLPASLETREILRKKTSDFLARSASFWDVEVSQEDLEFIVENTQGILGLFGRFHAHGDHETPSDDYVAAYLLRLVAEGSEYNWIFRWDHKSHRSWNRGMREIDALPAPENISVRELRNIDMAMKRLFRARHSR